MGELELKMGKTVNMGNYEFIRVDVAIKEDFEDLSVCDNDNSLWFSRAKRLLRQALEDAIDNLKGV